MTAEFVIHTAPEGKARPRVTSHGTYTPQRTRDFENFVRWEYRTQCRHNFGTAPICVIIVAYFPIPASTSKRKADAMLRLDVWPTKKPDADNIAKAVCDALNGYAYQDDAQIVSLSVAKRYAREPKIDVTITDYLEECHAGD